MASGWRIYCFWCILVLGMLSSGHCYVRIASIRSTSITTSFLPSRLTAFNPTTQHSRLYSASCSQTIVVAAPSKLTAWIFRLVPILRTIIHPTVAGGLLAGGLHAVTGPDHLAALLPSTVGKSLWVGARSGAIWGLGHGLSAIVLGLCAFFLKGKLTGQFSALEKLTYFAESAVGVSLVAIGLLGVKESIEASKDSDHSKESSGMSSSAIFANGVLHGFSWDGAPSLAPAIAMSSWRAACSFLLAYSVGTVIAMSISAGTIGALSSRIGKMSKTPDFPRGLSFFSSLLAMVVGLYWIAQSILRG